MKKIFLLFILISVFGFSQNTDFNFNNNNEMNLFVITEIQNKSANEIYTKTVEWINKMYKNPNEVILSKVENDYIRIEAIEKGLMVIPLGKEKSLKNDVKYQIEVYVKNNKYKFEIVSLDKYSEATLGWENIKSLNKITDDNSYNSFIEKLKKSGINTKYYTFERMQNFTKNYDLFSQYFNSLNKSLANYINGKEDSKKNDW